MPSKSDTTDDLSFEEAMERLESIVAGMEGGRMPLEEMVSSYEDGARLLRICRARIEKARQRVEVITANLDGNGKATLSEFDESGSSEMETPAKTKTPTPVARRSAATKPASPDDDEDSRLF